MKMLSEKKRYCVQIRQIWGEKVDKTWYYGIFQRNLGTKKKGMWNLDTEIKADCVHVWEWAIF